MSVISMAYAKDIAGGKSLSRRKKPRGAGMLGNPAKEARPWGVSNEPVI